MDFSILVPVVHGGPFLQETLRSLETLDYPAERFEVLVLGTRADEASRRTTEQFGGGRIRLDYAAAPSSSVSTLLNLGCTRARGAVFALADDDCILRPDWLKRLHHVFQSDAAVALVGGADELEGPAKAFDVTLDTLLNSSLGTGLFRNRRMRRGTKSGLQFPRLWNMAVRRTDAVQTSAVDDSGVIRVFNESLETLQDIDLALRIGGLGKRIVIDPDIRVGHRRDTTFWSFTKRNFRMGKESRILGVRRWAHRFLAMGVLCMPLVGWAVTASGPFTAAAGWAMGIYALWPLGAAVPAYRRSHSPKALILAPALLMSLHLSRGFGFLMGKPGAHRDGPP
jgi:GT2 family glycosyltransferase